MAAGGAPERPATSLAQARRSDEVAIGTGRLGWSCDASPATEETPITEDRMALIEAIQKADDGNFLRALAETVLQIIMDADVEALVGAGRHERADGRLT